MLSNLTVHGFRNLEGLDWSVEPGSHLLLGRNGAGKTSLLEALYLVATTRSFRTSQLRDCLQIGGVETFSIAARVVGERRAHLELSWSTQGVRRRLDSKSVSFAEYLAPLPVVVWSFKDGEVLEGSREQRRRLMDRGLVSVDPARLSIVQGYRLALRQKRELLRRDHDGLEEWNRLLATSAAGLARARSEYIGALRRELGIALGSTGLDLPPLDVVYRPSPAECLEGAAAIEERLRSVASEERRRRRPILGPHRDGLEILWGERDVSVVASAGEKKAVGLLLLVAQAAVLEHAGRPPVVMADDVDAELDLARLKAVWRSLASHRQIFMSSNRTEAREALDADFCWSVEGGRAEVEP